MSKRPAKSAAAAEPKADTYTRLTALIIDALSTATGPTEWPWVKAAKAGAPVNVVSEKPYRGLNRMLLGMAVHGGASRYFATFKQWQEKGAMVLKGSKGYPIVFWGEMHVDAAGNRVDQNTPGARKIVYAKGATVFHAGQVEGWTAPEDGTKEALELAQGATEREDVEAFIRHAGARVVVEGDRAFYAPGFDQITMPARKLFRDTAEADATTHFYGTMLHELVHWTGHTSRLDRLKPGRFGSEDYAMEELVAEIGSAFLNADLGLSPTPRADNVAYVQNWLSVLKGDTRAIFTASSAATKAADFLHAKQPKEDAPEIDSDHDEEEEEPAALAA